MTMEQLSAITGKGIAYLEDYLRLLDQGEERLIKGVEDVLYLPPRPLITIAQRVRVAHKGENLQNCF